MIIRGSFLVGLLFLAGSVLVDSRAAGEEMIEGDAQAIATIEPDVIYGRVDALAMTYDLLKPTAEANGATVIFMVSGGWVSRWFDPRLAMMPEIRGISLVHDLLVDGYHVIMLRHGSSPRYKVPDAADHVEKAVRHLRENAEERGLDPERIGSFGLSAGGHLSLHLATLGGERVPRYLRRARLGPEFDGRREAAPIAAAVAWFPPVELVSFVGPNERYPAMDFDPELAERVSPIRHVDAQDAPVLLLHGTEDSVVIPRASEAMKEAYDEAGLESELHIFEGAGHGFEGEDAARSSRLAKAWFDRWLLADDSTTEAAGAAGTR
ncbi:MAG: alpha/beta hydrolase [Phycisphaera sp.]|nr:alpha/beta hydrolase [Phycisphaera sp.]